MPSQNERTTKFSFDGMTKWISVRHLQFKSWYRAKMKRGYHDYIMLIKTKDKIQRDAITLRLHVSD